MSDDFKEPVSGADEAKPPKKKAEDNPWYLLATLYGAPERWGDELQVKNLTAWNRYYASSFDEKVRTNLIEEKRYRAEELAPFSPEELQEVAAAFAERCKALGKKLALPATDDNIDFSNVNFEQDAFFREYLFRRPDFNGAAFSRVAFFDRATFPGGALFDHATFSDQALFRNATFSSDVTFDAAAFSDYAGFDGATFSSGVTFNTAAFSGHAGFDGAIFSGMADFDYAAFSGGALFRFAAFSGRAYFRFAAFSDYAGFNGAIFSSMADFGCAAFSGGAHFNGATFSSDVRFAHTTFDGTTEFVNAKMKDETFFQGAIFKKEPPRFFNAELHQGTVWRDITWPPTPKGLDEAGPFIDAYACLKLEMDRLKKHEDELNFFALELQSRRVLQESKFRGSGIPIALYGLISDYGRSYLRPIVGLFLVAAFGASIFRHFGAFALGEAFSLSAANTFNVFGFRKDFIATKLLDCLSPWLEVTAATQTILGTILLFLFGLGIRNKFRMK